MSNQFTQLQPIDGDLLLVCPHIKAGKGERWHWYAIDLDPTTQAPVAVQFKRPDGTVGESKWMVICNACERTGRDPGLLVRGERIWEGNAPVVTKDVQ